MLPTIISIGKALVDVALKKPCKQSSVGWGGNPERAVNGDENNRYGRCVDIVIENNILNICKKSKILRMKDPINNVSRNITS